MLAIMSGSKKIKKVSLFHSFQVCFLIKSIVNQTDRHCKEVRKRTEFRCSFIEVTYSDTFSLQRLKLPSS